MFKKYNPEPLRDSDRPSSRSAFPAESLARGAGKTWTLESAGEDTRRQRPLPLFN